MVNIGIWGPGFKNTEAFRFLYRQIEHKCHELGATNACLHVRVLPKKNSRIYMTSENTFRLTRDIELRPYQRCKTKLVMQILVLGKLIIHGRIGITRILLVDWVTKWFARYLLCILQQRLPAQAVSIHAETHLYNLAL